MLPLVVRAGAGSVRDSMSVMDQLLAGAGDDGVTYAMATSLLGYTDGSLLDSVVDAFAAGDGAAAFEVVDRVIEGGNDPRRFVADLLERLRDLVILAAVPDAGEKGLIDAPADVVERMQAQASVFGAAELSRAADLVNAGAHGDARRDLAPSPARADLRPGAAARRLRRRAFRCRPGWTGWSAARPSRPPGPGPPWGTYRGLEAQAHAPVAMVPPGDGGPPRRGRPCGADAPRRPRPRAAPVQPASPRRPAPAAPAPAPAPAARRSGSRPPQRCPRVGSVPGLARRGPRRSPGAAPVAGRPPPPRVRHRPPVAPAAPAAGPPSPGPRPRCRPPPRPGMPQGAAQVRNMWPNILEAVKNRRRFTWILLSQNAQVTGFDGTTLQIGFLNAGARDNFASSGSEDVLQAGARRAVQRAVEDRGDRRPVGRRGTAPAADRRSGPAGGSAGAPAAPGRAAPQQPYEPRPAPRRAQARPQPGPAAPAAAPAPQPPAAPEPPRPVAPEDDTPGGRTTRISSTRRSPATT